ncbi:MAG TPA: YafY family protein [Solirubrobacteraceae bacterium]
MLTTSARLLELLSLLQSRRDWSGSELAWRLEVDVRTIRRDIERLRALGYPVSAARGVAGGYRLGAGASLPPLLLDGEEAVAVAVALGTAASAGVDGIEETSVRALTKLEGLLPTPLRRRVAALSATLVRYPGRGPTVSADTLVAIAAAARDLERLRFDYDDREGAHSRRLVEPHSLVHNGRRWYLVAWDCGREDWRTFRVDRIQPRLSTDRRFAPRTPPATDIAAYVADGIASTRERHHAEILLHAPLAELSGRVPGYVGTLEALDARSCLLRSSADWLGGLAVYVADIGVDFEVREPPELVELVAQLAERFARAARPARRS